MSLNNVIDVAVDKAATAAKSKVKGMLGGGGGQKQPQSGGIGGLFPSAGEGGSKGSKGKSGGFLDGFLTKAEPKPVPKPEPRPEPTPVANPGAAGGTTDDFNSAVDELCDF